YSWGVLLSAFLAEVNRFDGKEIKDWGVKEITERTLQYMHKVYPTVDREEFREDLDEILDVLFQVARGGRPDAAIEKLSIRAYGRYMWAPHRMDLMVSAMTDREGAWQCNQKCRFCYAAGQHAAGGQELSTREWEDALDRLRRAGVPMVTFTGGEPTLRKDLVQLVEHAKWFVTRLNTNGRALTASLALQLRQAGLDSVQITLYSADEAIHNELVGVDGFDDTVRGIRNALVAGLDVSVNTPLCKRNGDYLSTLKMLCGFGVRFVTLSGLICTGVAESNHGEYDLSGDELFAIVREAKAFCDAHGMEMGFTSPGLIPAARLEAVGLNVPACGAALSNMAVAPDGTVVPCQSWLSREGNLGNILTDPFKKIWKHPLCASLRKMTQEQALCCPFRNGGKEVSGYGKKEKA
ncbi:MAG: radical SAM protein, partial [Clostridia bacterium]|nr:radical SAM protein [Clostridia bacterium]